LGRGGEIGGRGSAGSIRNSVVINRLQNEGGREKKKQAGVGKYRGLEKKKLGEAKELNRKKQGNGGGTGAMGLREEDNTAQENKRSRSQPKRRKLS